MLMTLRRMAEKDAELAAGDEKRFAFFSRLTEQEARACFADIADAEWPRAYKGLFESCEHIGREPTTNGEYVPYRGHANIGRYLLVRLNGETIGRNEARHVCHVGICANLHHLVSGTGEQNLEDTRLARADGRLPPRRAYATVSQLMRARVMVNRSDTVEIERFAAQEGLTPKTVRRMLEGGEQFVWAGPNTIRAPEHDALEAEWSEWNERLDAWLERIGPKRSFAATRRNEQAGLLAD